MRESKPAPYSPDIYYGLKRVKAIPMTRGDYNKLRGWAVPADENPEDAGFLVEYLDSPGGNVDGFQGYVSWSPAAVFEQSYFSLNSPKGIKLHGVYRDIY